MRLKRLLPYLEAQTIAKLLADGFQVGFYVPPFVGSGCQMVDNAKSVFLKKDIVREKTYSEIREGRIAGPFSSPPFPYFRLPPLAIVPKKEPGTYRLIHNLLYSKEFSLNDLTDTSTARVHYASFDDALSMLRFYGKGDIKSAFRLLPINPIG